MTLNPFQFVIDQAKHAITGGDAPSLAPPIAPGGPTGQRDYWAFSKPEAKPFPDNMPIDTVDTGANSGFPGWGSGDSGKSLKERGYPDPRNCTGADCTTPSA